LRQPDDDWGHIDLLDFCAEHPDEDRQATAGLPEDDCDVLIGARRRPSESWLCVLVAVELIVESGWCRVCLGVCAVVLLLSCCLFLVLVVRVWFGCLCWCSALCGVLVVFRCGCAVLLVVLLLVFLVCVFGWCVWRCLCGCRVCVCAFGLLDFRGRRSGACARP